MHALEIKIHTRITHTFNFVLQRWETTANSIVIETEFNSDIV